ncbi:hypothetical protein ACQPXH_21200 [Nocardia sp. CA-135953]|uniref:hypothetical protein n=1 Tax=Nocardia sp. CA-135953 TaxID=3239978 RepID=UPI003D986737
MRLLETAGSDQTILNSDGGILGAPPPPELLAFGLKRPAGAGVPDEVLRRLANDNPRRLLAAQLAVNS